MNETIKRLQIELAKIVPEAADLSLQIRAIALLESGAALVAVESNALAVDAIEKCRVAVTSHPEIARSIGANELLFVKWDAVPERFIANAFAPATVIEVRSETDGVSGRRIARVLVDESGLDAVYDLDAGERPRLASVLTQCDLEIVLSR
jgi:transcription antitermination factor NusA-like protein